MFTRIWYKAIGRILTNVSGVKYTNSSGNTSTLPTGSSSTYFTYLYLTTALKNVQSSVNQTSTDRVLLGTGTTPPTLDDYKLSGNILDSSTISTAVGTTSTIDDDGYSITATYTVTNISSNKITIGEIGCFCNTGGTNGNCLMEHTVLDEPVQITAGGIGVVTYTIRMNFPWATA